MEVLRTLVFREKAVSARDGRWFAARIMPYRTQDNVIDGVVVTFTEARSLEAGFDWHLAKPPRVDALTRLLAEAQPH